MRYWSWIAIAIAVVALAALIYPLVQTKQRLTLVQSELGRATEQVVQARAGTAELEKVIANLKIELDAANKTRTQLQANLDAANSEIEQSKKQLGAAKAKLVENQSKNEELGAQLQEAKRAADEFTGKTLGKRPTGC